MTQGFASLGFNSCFSGMIKIINVKQNGNVSGIQEAKDRTTVKKAVGKIGALITSCVAQSPAEKLKTRWAARAKANNVQLSDYFYNKVIQISKQLNCDPNDLMQMMYSESGLDPHKLNSSGSAVGIIQFTDRAAQTVGIPWSKIAKMSADQQIDLVAQLLPAAKKQAKIPDNKHVDLGTLYALNYLPARADKEVLCRKGETGKDGKLLRYYESNSKMDLNKDGKITKSELVKFSNRS